MSSSNSPTLALNTAEFLAKNWQQKPCLLRQTWADFVEPISPELLAGLAMEEGVDARVVSQQHNENGVDWQVEHGPFTDYEAFGEEDWTLLVQSVNEWWPEAQQLLSQFHFLPDWRVDDVMVSFATPGGSVGPHLDQYDVFIIQGEGERRWQVGKRQPLQQHRPHPDLQQLAEPFEPLIDEVLQAGDMLYIPAGCPHHGEAITPSLNYSIGFRAPVQLELQAAVADMLLDADITGPRYQDEHASDYGSSWQVSETQLARLREFILQTPAADAFNQAIMQVLSQSKRPLPQPELDLEPEQLQQMKTDGVWLCRTPGARLLVTDQARAFVNGEELEGAQQVPELVVQLAAQNDDQPLAELAIHQATHARIIAQLINAGAWFLSVEEQA